MILTKDLEWLATNGIGGFACGSVEGAPKRKYHSLLNAALPAPYGRTVMLNYVLEEVIYGEKISPLSSLHLNQKELAPLDWTVDFRLENGIPYWRYEKDEIVIEKSLFLINKQNTVCIFYKLLSAQEDVSIRWRPFFHFRMNEQAVNTPIDNENYLVRTMGSKYEVECPHFPILRILDEAHATFTADSLEVKEVFYEAEQLRGYEHLGTLKSPGFFSFALKPKQKQAFLVSTEEWATIEALAPQEAFLLEKFRRKNLLKTAKAQEKSVKARLTLAADQFLMSPLTRFKDHIKLKAAGEEIRSVIAGFPWFTDWGRDTMISLEGLTLCTGRYQDAHAILYTFSTYVKNGLIPNMFPDGASEGIYNTADATLWFFHAIDRYVEMTNDTELLDFLLPCLSDIIQCHLKGTLFGIYVDEDGLLVQGKENYALTWMDAKMGDWVVTPRRGKAVEINALWYNALSLFEKWTKTTLPVTKQCYQSFNKEFWYAEKGYLYDVIDGKNKDASLRPNQLFAISLSYPVLEEDKWKSVVDVAERELLTPYGLRTLSAFDPNYQQYYHGDLTARDGAYHQGTVWPWLIGPFVDAWLKVHPRSEKKVEEFIKPLIEQLFHNCVGSIGEIYDAKDPYNARGCFAQAWSVAELLRIVTKINYFGP